MHKLSNPPESPSKLSKTKDSGGWGENGWDGIIAPKVAVYCSLESTRSEAHSYLLYAVGAKQGPDVFWNEKVSIMALLSFKSFKVQILFSAQIKAYASLLRTRTKVKDNHRLSNSQAGD